MGAWHPRTVDRVRVGLIFRALRRERHLRQVDVAKRAGVSQQTVSNLERGRFGSLSIDTYSAVANALGAEATLEPRWRGGKLARLLDRRHARLQNIVAAMLVARGWEILTEATFNRYGDRGSLDLLAWRKDYLALLIIEIKTELDSIEETVRVLHMKTRVVPPLVARDLGWRPAHLGVVLVLPSGSTHRDAVARHAASLGASFPSRTVEVRQWIQTPSGPLRGILFLRDTNPGGDNEKPQPPDRVRRPRHVPGETPKTLLEPSGPGLRASGRGLMGSDRSI